MIYQNEIKQNRIEAQKFFEENTVHGCPASSKMKWEERNEKNGGKMKQNSPING